MRSNNASLRLLLKYRFRLYERGLNNEKLNDKIRVLQKLISEFKKEYKILQNKYTL
jgi:hypothetical protein